MKALNFSFFPKKIDFFAYFSEQMTLIKEASNRLVEFFDEPSEQKMYEIERMESKGDEVYADLRQKLNSTFITPLEREDIHDLGASLDDILDFMKSAAERFWLYQPKQVTAKAKEMVRHLHDMVEVLDVVISKLKKLEDVSEEVSHISKMECQGDALNRKAIGELFNDGMEVMEVIKWKELYEKLEEAMDRCHHTAIMVENIIFKHT